MKPEFKAYSEVYTENQILKCDENNKFFYLETKNACFAKVKIDNGVEPENSKVLKCDYLIIKQNIEDIEIFVELKGEDIRQGSEQLKATYKKYATKTDNIKHYPILVSSPIKTPKARTIKDNIKVELSALFKNTLLIKENVIKARYVSTNNSIAKIN